MKQISEVCESKNIGEKIRLLRREIKKLQREIFGTDKNSRSRYVQEFTREFSRYQTVVSEEELNRAIAQSQLIYVGDYHALPQVQHYAAALLEQIAEENPVILGLEVFYTRNQEALDQFMRGKITEDVFLDRIRYSMEWGYDWEPYRQILENCRRLHVPVYGIDCPPRNDLRMIHKRDHCVGARIADLLVRHPQSKIMVLFGEAHLASSHLPARVSEVLARQLKRVRTTTILLNMDEIYWKLSCEGKENASWILLKPNVFCVFNANPYMKYEAYYQLLERWKSEAGAEV